MKIRFLGTASNGGWPQQDCRCSNCEAARDNLKLVRLRSSLAFSEGEGKWSVIDCGPDFKKQLLVQNWLIQDLKLITLTHLHPDHTIGLAELGFGKIHHIKVVVPNKMKREMMENNIFAHLFETGFAKFAKSKSLRFIPISHWPKHSCFAIVFGKLKKVLFASDCAIIDDNLLMEMTKVDLVIFDGTFLDESKFNHLSIRESCQILSGLKKPVIFTHVNHSENVEEIINIIEKFNFNIAFDNMEINI